MNLKAVAWVAPVVFVGCATSQERGTNGARAAGHPPEAGAVVPGVGPPMFPVVSIDGATLVDATLAEYQAIEGLPSLPADASHIYLQTENAMDGHIFILRYESTSPPSRRACEDTCVDENRIHGSLPELWPTREEIHAPAWLVDMSSTDLEGWTKVDATPHSVQVDGKIVPCGFSRATGRGVFSEPGKKQTTIVDFSIQWFRLGCGG